MFSMLNMRLVSTSSEGPDHHSGDITARARIRNAAIEVIGTHGFERASMRMIAQRAGVSPALVVHHFGDKLGLRAACTAHVTALFTDDRQGDASVTIDTIQAALANLDACGPALGYLSQLLADDSDAADELFDGILRGTQQSVVDQQEAGVIHRQSDPASTALLLTLFGLAPIVMRRQFARALGVDELTPEAIARITLPMLELFTHGFYADDSILRATRAAMGVPEEEPEEGERS